MIYTTLKANREAGINFVDFIDECITVIGRFFGEEYVDENDYTNWDKLSEDFSKSKIESIVLKSIKEDAKDKEDGIFFKYGKILIERDYAFDDIRKAVQLGLLTCSDLRKTLIELMQHDKKNSGGKISFSLVSDFGKYQYDVNCSEEDICQAFSFYNQMNL